MPNQGAQTADPHELSPAAGDSLTKERRRHWRFLATYRVEYVWDDRPCISFMGNLSLGGMYLRGAQSLADGEEVEFKLHLDDKNPLVLRGKLTNRQKSGAGIRFSPGQHNPLTALRKYVNESIVPKLERGVSGRRPSADKVRELTTLYQELGRPDDAQALLRRGIEASPRDLDLHERLVGFLWQRVHDGAERGGDLLSEIDTLIAAGLHLGDSEVLTVVQQKVVDIRRHVEAQEDEERRRREDELLAGKLAARVEEVLAKERRSLENEFRARVEGIVQARQRELEAALDERVRSEVAKKLEDMGAATESAVDKALTLAKLYEIQKGDQVGVEAAVTQRRAALEKDYETRSKLLEQEYMARHLESERARDSEVHELRQHLAEAREALIQATGELDERRQHLAREREAVAAQAAALDPERDELAVERRALDAARAALAEQAASLAREREAVTEQAAAQRVEQTQLDELGLLLKERQERLAQDAAALAAHHQELAAYQEKLEARAGEVAADEANANGKLAEIEAGEKSVQRIDALTATQGTLERQLDQLHGELVAWQRRTDEALAESARVQEHADAVDNAAAAITEERDALLAQIDELRQVLAARDAEIAAQQAHLSEREQALAEESEALRIREQLAHDVHADLQSWRARAQSAIDEAQGLRQQVEHERSQVLLWQERALSAASEVQATSASGNAGDATAWRSEQMQTLSAALTEEKSYLKQESTRLQAERATIEDRVRALDEQQNRLRFGWLALEQERADWEKTRSVPMPMPRPTLSVPPQPRRVRRLAVAFGAAAAVVLAIVLVVSKAEDPPSGAAESAAASADPPPSPADVPIPPPEVAREENAGEADAATSEALEKAKKHLQRGHDFLGKNKFADAVREYRKAQALAPDDGLVQRSLGIAFSGLGNVDKAIAAYKNYLRLMPDAADGAQVRAMIDEYEAAATAHRQ